MALSVIYWFLMIYTYHQLLLQSLYKSRVIIFEILASITTWNFGFNTKVLCLIIFLSCDSQSYMTLFSYFLFEKKNGNYFQVNEFLSSQEGTAKQKMTTEEVAMGFIQVANEAMCRPIRALTQVRQFTYLTPISRKFSWRVTRFLTINGGVPYQIFQRIVFL